MLSKKINKNIKNICSKLAIFLSLILALTSCRDNGCIEADDYGQYEFQRLNVQANAMADNCKFDPVSDPDATLVIDPDFKRCLTLDSGSFDAIETLEDGSSKVESKDKEEGKGCSNFGGDLLSFCIDDCVRKCQSKNVSNSTNAGTAWTSTDERSPYMNYGVTIEPGTEIIIRTTGNIVLDSANSKRLGSMSVNPKISTPNSYNDSSFNSQKFFDVTAGTTLNLSYYGSAGNLNSGTSNTVDENSINFAKRLIAYFMEHPSRYEFNVNAASELSGNKGVPIWPNRDTWKCEMIDEGEGESATKRLSCYGDYEGLYDNIQPGNDTINNDIINQVYPIISRIGTTINQGVYGGVIRTTTEDHLTPENYDPFIDVTCNPSGVCDQGTNSNTFQGKVGNLADGFTYTNNQRAAIKLFFKTIPDSAGSNCQNITLPIKIFDARGNTIFPDPFVPSGGGEYYNFTANSTSWNSFIGGSYGTINIEPGYGLQIGNVEETNASGTNCGNFLFYKTHAFYDISIETSGFVSFKKLIDDGNVCSIYGRIVNPYGSHTTLNIDVNNEDSGGITYEDLKLPPDFYEYQINEDPLNSNTSVDSQWSSKDIFVRKGQKLRIDPRSWNSNRYSNGDKKTECGVGYTLYIQPRPAILCYGTQIQNESNPDCFIQDIKDGVISGCKPDTLACFPKNADGSYAGSCNPQCYNKFNCPITNTKVSQKTCLDENITMPTIAADLKNPGNDCPSQGEYDSCASCNIARRLMVQQPAFIELNTSLCVDFEEYKGSVRNIFSEHHTSDKVYDPSTGEYTLGTNLKTYNPYRKLTEGIDRGATLIGNFNGKYGAFKEVRAEGSQGGKLILKSINPATFTSSGRLMFFHAEDAADFRNINNEYNSSSGAINIDFTGDTSGTNGQYMEVALCKEETPGACSSNSITKLESIITYNDEGELIDGKYKFGDSGYIERTQKDFPSAQECTDEAHGTQMAPFLRYYCHINGYVANDNNEDKSENEPDPKDEYKKYRLSFKIKDPEEAKCKIGDPNAGSSEWNGIIISNQSYVAGDDNDQKVCAPSDDEGDNVCKKQFRCVSKYYNNEGSYTVEIRVKTTNKQTSKMIGSVINPIVTMIDGDPNSDEPGRVESIYKSIITDPMYKSIVKMAMIMMITFYGFSYLMGVSNFSNAEIVSRVIKIAIIYFFIGEDGWEWFNMFVVNLFKNSTNELSFLMASSFDDTPEITESINTNNFSDKSILFSSVDKVFDLIFTGTVQNKITALFFTGIFGWAYFLLVCYGILLYIYAVANAVLIYLTAQIFMSILFIVGPIFIIFILFKQTQDMFDNWLKALIGFALQQIFLLTTLAFFNMLIYEVIKLVLNYRICYRPVWVIDIWLIKLTILKYWTISSSPPVVSAHSQPGLNNNMEDFPSLFSVLFIWVIASLMGKFIEFMTNLATSIGGGISASELGGGVRQAMSQVKGAGMHIAKRSPVGQAISHSVARVDQALFDSGRLAKADRARKKAEVKKDASDKRSLASSANKAVSDYKKNNASEFAAMSEEQKQAKLKSVRDEAMKEQAKKLGISEERLEKLKNQTGINYAGKNVFGAAMTAAYQGSVSGGALTTSLEEKNKSAKTSLTRSEAKASMKLDEKNLSKAQQEKLDDLMDNQGKTKKEAMAEISKEHRNDLLEKFKDGDLKIQKSTSEKAYDNVKDATKKIASGTKKVATGSLQTAGGVVAGSAGLAVSAAGKAGGGSRLTELGANLRARATESLKSGTKNIAKGAIKSTIGAATTAAVGKENTKSAQNAIADTAQYVGSGRAFNDAKSSAGNTINRASNAARNATSSALKAIGTKEGRAAMASSAKSAAISGASAVKSAAMNPLDTMRSAADSAARGVAKAGIATGSKEYKEARQQLIDENEISDITQTGNMTHSDQESSKINDRVQRNKQQKSKGKTDFKEISKLEKMADQMNKSEEISSDRNSNIISRTARQAISKVSGTISGGGNDQKKSIQNIKNQEHYKETKDTRSQISQLKDKIDKVDNAIHSENDFTEEERNQAQNERTSLSNQLENYSQKLEKLENDPITQTDSYQNYAKQKEEEEENSRNTANDASDQDDSVNQDNSTQPTEDDKNKPNAGNEDDANNPASDYDKTQQPNNDDKNNKP